MGYAKQMLDAYPRSFNLDASLLADAIEAAMDVAGYIHAVSRGPTTERPSHEWLAQGGVAVS